MNNLTQDIALASKKETKERIWEILETVYDPEIPVLTILDLGIVREVRFDDSIHSPHGGWKVIITPTYSGCPAMDVIGMNIRKALIDNGFDKIEITYQLSPAWTTDWLTEKGKEKLKSFGIAPPVSKTFDIDYLRSLPVECPHCRSKNTKLVSQFGSTACKALYQCDNCGEPFDYFKCH
ncbi:MAG: 1,2-phenylacetyl-CoA epoxidase subunit PaaD [Ginsengibacter sp.]